MDLQHFGALEALQVAISGFTVVFLMLVLLWMIIRFISLITSRLTPSVSKPLPQPAAAEEKTDEDKKIAVILAVIAAARQTKEAELRVRRIQKVQ